MTARRFTRRPAEVEAIQLAADNADEVAAWASGAVVDGGLRLPQSVIPPEPGDWIVRSVLPGGQSPAFPVKPDVFDWAWRPKYIDGGGRC